MPAGQLGRKVIGNVRHLIPAFLSRRRGDDLGAAIAFAKGGHVHGSRSSANTLSKNKSIRDADYLPATLSAFVNKRAL